MEKSIEEFQCKIHEFSKNKDWINLKRSFIRAPQIFKQKLNIGSTLPLDEEFEFLNEKFHNFNDEFQILQFEITRYHDMTIEFLKNLINLIDIFSKMFFDSSINEFDLIAKGYMELALKFLNKLKEIEVKINKNLEIFLNNIKNPLISLLNINKRIKLYIKERNFSTLDINKYTNNINILNEKINRNERLSLKQEENLIRYQKNLELSQLKFNKFNDTLKLELPIYFNLMNQLLKPIFINIYFNQLTNFYYFLNINEIDNEPLFKLRTKELEINSNSFFNNLIDKYHKNMEKIKINLDSLLLIKPKLELSLSNDDDQFSYASSSVKTDLNQFATANFDFVALEPGDLSFKKGDRIKILDNKISNDWWKGELNNNIGIFPSNYVSL